MLTGIVYSQVVIYRRAFVKTWTQHGPSDEEVVEGKSNPISLK